MFRGHGHTKIFIKLTVVDVALPLYNCCHNTTYPKVDHMVAIGIKILEFLNNFINSIHSAAHCEQQQGRVPRSWAYKNTCQNDNCWCCSSLKIFGTHYTEWEGPLCFTKIYIWGVSWLLFKCGIQEPILQVWNLKFSHICFTWCVYCSKPTIHK